MQRRAFLVLLFASAACHGGGDEGPPLPWTKDRALAPADLAARLGKPGAPRVVHVGPQVLFTHAHVPGAVYGGEARDPAGIEAVARLLEPLPRDEEIVLYCGCCPYKNCPNIRPAYTRAVAMGFRNVRVLDLPTTFKAEWTERGFPVEKG